MSDVFKPVRFFQGIKAWAANTNLEEGQLITATFGGIRSTTLCVLMAMRDFVTTGKLDLAELKGPSTEKTDRYQLAMQQDTVRWQAESLTPTGLKVTLNGFYGESRSLRVTGKTFNYGEWLAFNATATGATGVGTFVYQPKHGFVVGNWLSRTDDGTFVLAQPDDSRLRETEGRVSYTIGTDAFFIECNGYGCDPQIADDDNFWDYDIDTELFLDVDGTATDVKPTDRPYRSLGRIVEAGYFLINQRTVYPNNYCPWFESWPTDAMLKAPLGQDGFRCFIYLGGEAGREPGTYINPNAGKTGAISAPTRL